MVGVIEGSHRINLAIRVATGEAVTNSFHLTEREKNAKNSYSPNFNKSFFNDMFDVMIKIPFDSLPTCSDCQDASKAILNSQERGYIHSLGNVLLNCKETYTCIIQTLIVETEDKNLHRDISIDWYNF